MIKAYGEYLRTGPKRGGIIQTIFGKFVNMKYQSKINYFRVLCGFPVSEDFYSLYFPPKDPVLWF